MNSVFADTSYYIALMSDSDAYHDQAVNLSRSFQGQVITTDFVLMEVGNWLSRITDRTYFLTLLELLQADPQTTIVPATRDLFDMGCSMFARRMDKNWSLTDCISFTIMLQKRLAEALTTDHHFEQAGFTILIK